jgi:hypothetical protein
MKKKEIDKLLQRYPHIHVIYMTFDKNYKELLNRN